MRRLNQRGFTLSELMLAAMIIAFCLTGILAFFMNSTLLNQSNRDTISASSHCQYILEDIRNTPFSQVSAKVGNGDWNLTAAELAASPYNFTVLPNETVVTSVFQSGNPLGVSVNVTYKLQGRMDRAYELRTLFTD